MIVNFIHFCIQVVFNYLINVNVHRDLDLLVLFIVSLHRFKQKPSHSLRPIPLQEIFDSGRKL